MPSRLTYADAVALLGGNNKIVTALDRLTGGLLIAATGGGSELALSLFDAKGEVSRLSHELVGGLTDRMRGLSRFDRTQRLAAAHMVLVVSAYFEAVSSTDLPFRLDDLDLSKSDQLAIAGAPGAASDRLAAVVMALNACSTIPVHSPRFSYERTLDGLRDYYTSVSGDLVRFIQCLAVWDRLDDTARSHLAEHLETQVPNVAVYKYEESFRRLCVEFPEMAFWVDRADHQATRAEIEQLNTGLRGLSELLDRISLGGAPDDRREALARRYRKQLERPIASTGQAPEGLTIPTLANAYVHPSFRAGLAVPNSSLAEEGWWNERPEVRHDLQSFLIGHLTSPIASSVPLLVLGQPGSGKSVLTQVLAARLPVADFMVVRVVLRDTLVDTDLQAQIEHAIRDATGDAVSWPDLARTAGDALPVVILDGFDELLQATGVSQSDYLERIVQFQEREADHDRPVAVIVTSRTAVADRARIPTGGCVALRLEPFSDDQVRHWLDIWNRTNRHQLERRSLRPLTPEIALRQEELARQPLLLLMLALYDADANALQNEGEALDLADLYERLLTRFAQREVTKTSPGLDTQTLRDEVEDELLRLSVAAIGMFNRGRQWITQEELTGDMEALDTPLPPQPESANGFRARLTGGQTVIGRFFFIHQSQAMRDDTRLSTYEFLHATFGEFLVARLVKRELVDLLALSRIRTSRTRSQPTDDGFLYDLISFAPLTDREPVIAFLEQLLARLPQDERTALADLLLTLFRAAPDTHRGPRKYEPAHLTIIQRMAEHTVNLVLLATIAKGRINGCDLFPDGTELQWTSHAQLWQSQLSTSAWQSLIATLRLERIWLDDEPEIELTIDRSARRTPFTNASWLLGHKSLQLDFYWLDGATKRASAIFTCDENEEVMIHALEPLFGEGVDFDYVTMFHVGGDGESISTAHALIGLWVQSSQLDLPTPDALMAAYDQCLSAYHAQGLVAPEFLAHVLRQLSADRDFLPRNWRADVLERLRQALEAEPRLWRWARQAFFDLDLGFMETDQPRQG